MRRFYFSIAGLLLSAVSFGQAHVQKLRAPLAGTVVLRDVDDKYNAQVYSLEMPDPDEGGTDAERLEHIKARIAKLYPHQKQTTPAQYKVTQSLAPTVTMGFVADSFPGIPPDNDVAISKGNKAVSVMNSNIAVLDATTGKMTTRKTLRNFSLAVGLSNIQVDYRYDPKVMYDPEADRFISIMLNSTNADNYIVVGFSQSNDPSGRWNFYKFYGNYGNDTTWFDFPCIAMTKDDFFFTGNKVLFDTTWQAGFRQTVIYQLSKKDGYDSSANLTYKIWDNITYNGEHIRNIYPVKASFDQLLGPEQYFLSNKNFDVSADTIYLVKISDNVNSSNAALTVTAMKSPTTYGVPPDGRQMDTSAVLATNDGRILGAYAEGDQIQFVSASVNPSSGASGVYHAQIYDYKTNPHITFANIYSIDTLDFGYPNIAFAGNPWGLNQSLISFNYTGPNTYAGVGAILFDGTSYSDLVKIKEGTGIIDRGLPGKEERWGDYMGAQPDYNNYGSMWVLGIYGRSDKNYGNWMAKLSSPLLGVKEQKKRAIADAILYPNPSTQYIQLEFIVDKGSVLNFAIYNTGGQLVDNILQQKCEEGKNLIRFNIAPLPVGTYYLETQRDGSPVAISRFVKQ